MARYKDYNYDQSKMLPVTFSEQILAGTFEYTVNYLVDNEMDLSIFEERYNNDDGGRPAYDPALLLKIILVAYSRGITSSRGIERLCRENVVFMALSADTQPHFTTIADFISRMHEVIEPLFIEVLMTCNSQGLIGGDMFAIDGCKMPSNASKEWSGTRADMTRKYRKIDRAVRRMLSRHREEDDARQDNDHTLRLREEQQIKKLREASRKIKKFCTTVDDKRGISGRIVQSNITDNDSAKMKTSRGVIQGYNGVAAVDNKHQIVIAAEAFGQGPENNLFAPITEAVKRNLGDKAVADSKITADSGFHSQATLQHCQDEHLDAYIADGNFRKRDPRFSTFERFKPKERQRKYFKSEDFHYDQASDSCRCPAGNSLWKSYNRTIDGNAYVTFEGYLNECRACPLQARCMRQPANVRGRQVSIKLHGRAQAELNLIDEMKLKIDSRQGRAIYAQRLGTVEPVFGNINTSKRLNRFSLRGKQKVNAQWLLYCMVHNVEKLQRYSSIAA